MKRTDGRTLVDFSFSILSKAAMHSSSIPTPLIERPDPGFDDRVEGEFDVEPLLDVLTGGGFASASASSILASAAPDASLT